MSLLRGFEKQSVNPFHCRPCRKTSAQVHCRQDEPCHWPGYSARQGRAGDPEDPRQESTNPREPNHCFDRNPIVFEAADS